MKRLATVTIAAVTLLLGSGSPGVRPRAAVTDYPSNAGNATASIGAAVIPPGEAKKIFGADLADYIVLEVGVFPAPGKEPDISPLDFTLLSDPDSISARSVDSDSVAATVIKDPNSRPGLPGNVALTNEVWVNHDSYPDPATGRRTGATGVGTAAGVGIGVPSGPNYPAPGTSQNRHQLEQQLWQKSLPDGKTTREVAGYLYFPKPSKKTKNAAWTLRWDGPSGRVNVALANPGR